MTFYHTTVSSETTHHRAVCHGPAAISQVKLSNGQYLIKGYKVTGFSNSEEDTVQLSKYMPFMLQDVLNENSGGNYVKADQDWSEKVVSEKGGKLITGQNPASGEFLSLWI
jgi:putative intracellular protease/amidase